jgi:hypothetical protein
VLGDGPERGLQLAIDGFGHRRRISPELFFALVLVGGAL